METSINYIMVNGNWVRKLIGKPLADTTPDCEFDARRIHLIMRLIYHSQQRKATFSVSRQSPNLTAAIYAQVPLPLSPAT
jgi:hypothetical protein